MATADDVEGGSSTEEDARLAQLRTLLLGADYQQALDRLMAESDTERVARVLAEALHERARRDASLSRVLAPLLDTAIDTAIQQHPKRITQVIYPVMGPAIRKAVAAAFADMVQTLNAVLSNSLSARAWVWRWQAWRAGKSYGEYVLLKTLHFRVEQVFLIHRETGLLLQDAGLHSDSSGDPELVSSMLTAINDFVADSFHPDSGFQLDTVRVGEFTLQMASGPFAVLAAAIRGNPTSDVNQTLHTVLEQIHVEYRTALEGFTGDKDAFTATQPLLGQCLIQQSTEPGSATPWKAYLVLLVLGLMGTGYSLSAWLDERAYQSIIAQVAEQPGYLVLNDERTQHQLHLKVLRALDSRDTQAVLANLETGPWQVSLEDHRVPLNVEAQWQTLLALAARPVPAPLALRPEPTPPPSQQQLAWDAWQGARAELQALRFYFQAGKDRLLPEEHIKLPRAVQLMKTLQQQTATLGLTEFHVLITGYADNSGSEASNLAISQQRADRLADLLRSNVDEPLPITAWGAGPIDLAGMPPEQERIVTFQVLHAKVKDRDTGH